VPPAAGWRTNADAVTQVGRPAPAGPACRGRRRRSGRLDRRVPALERGRAHDRPRSGRHRRRPVAHAQYKGFRFDIGGHRFFTKIEPVQRLWEEILGDEFIDVPRLSRIYYDGKFFDYPLKAANALSGLGVLNAVQIV
jgi:hypothetical protein